MTVWQHENSLILASKSQARQRLLREQGLEFLAIPAAVDERQIQTHLGLLSVNQQAMALAQAKALAVSKDYPAHWIIGSDQLLVCEGQILHQVSDQAGALTQLKTLSGRWHCLQSAVCLAYAGSIVAECEDKADLLMKPMSERDITHYLERVGQTVFGSVGCYHIEGEGIGLFDAVEGKRSTIMGMPIEQLIGLMHKQGLIRQ